MRGNTKPSVRSRRRQMPGQCEITSHSPDYLLPCVSSYSLDSLCPLHFVSDQRKINQKEVSRRSAEEHTRALCQFTGFTVRVCEHASGTGKGRGLWWSGLITLSVSLQDTSTLLYLGQELSLISGSDQLGTRAGW